MLRIVYHEGDKKRKSFYVCLDLDDLHKLGQVIKRAETKEGATRLALRESGMKILGGEQ
jgi:hypothetical protein